MKIKYKAIGRPSIRPPMWDRTVDHFSEEMFSMAYLKIRRQINGRIGTQILFELRMHVSDKARRS